MSWFRDYTRSSIGMKQLMAVTGLALALFVLQHMLGNLQMFLGKDQFNGYAEGLKSLGPLLWIARGGLLVIFVIHVFTAIRLIQLNRGARESKYVKYTPQRSTFYSRWMSMTGILLLAFVVYHLLHFTFGVTDPDAFNQLEEAHVGRFISGANPADFQRHDAYKMVVMGFSKVPIAIGYIVLMAMLCMHLAHGVRSFLQTLGANHPKYNKLFNAAGPIYGWVTFLGFIAVPIGVLAGVIKL